MAAGGTDVRQARAAGARRSRAADDSGARSSATTRTSGSRSARTAARSSASTTPDSRARAAPADASALIVADPRERVRRRSAASWPRPMTVDRRRRRFYRLGAAGTPAGLGGAAALPPLDFLLEPSRLPTNWLGFTSLRAVVIGPTEWEQLNDAQKSALLTWTACGGDLIFVDGDLGALFPAAQAPAPAGERARSAAYFFGRIHRPTSASIDGGGPGRRAVADAQTLQDANWALPANSAARLGHHRRARLPAADSRRRRRAGPGLPVDPDRVQRADRAGQLLVPAAQAPAGAAGADRAADLRACSSLLLAGYVARRRRPRRARPRRHVHDARSGQEAGRRRARSMSLYAAGMTPSGGLRFPRDVAVFPIGPDGTGSREQHGARSHRRAALHRGRHAGAVADQPRADRVPAGARAAHLHAARPAA